MGRLVVLLIFFVIFTVFKLALKGAKKAGDIAKDAYDAANSGEPFMDSFNKMRAQGKLSLPEAVIAMLTKIAKSDGKISELEAEMITRVIDDFVDIVRAKELNIDTTLYRHQLVAVSREARDNSEDITFYAKTIQYDSIEIQEIVITQLVILASIDGFTSIQENVINKVASTITFPSTRLQRILDQFINISQEEKESYGSSDPYEVLGCTRSDSDAIIKSKYRALVKKFHPDVIQGKNLDDEFVAFAAHKMKEINQAYDKIKKERRF